MPTKRPKDAFGPLSDVMVRRGVDEGITIDWEWSKGGPSFGDLFSVVGYVHPDFPPEGKFDFSSVSGLGFTQIDDFFGLRRRNAIIWLIPLIGGKEVVHHQGPYTGLRLTYSVHGGRFDCQLWLPIVNALARVLSAPMQYHLRDISFGKQPHHKMLAMDIDALNRHLDQNDAEVTTAPASSESIGLGRVEFEEVLGDIVAPEYGFHYVNQKDFVERIHQTYRDACCPNPVKPWLRARLAQEFQFLEKPPDWSNEPEWPFHDGIPMLFVTQFRPPKPPPIRQISYGFEMVYVFAFNQIRPDGYRMLTHYLFAQDRDGTILTRHFKDQY